MKPVARLSVSLKSSRRLLLVQSLAHGMAAVAVLTASLPPWMAALLLLSVATSLAWQRRNRPIRGLVLRGDGRLETVGADDTAIEVSLHPHTLVLSFLVVLLYRQEGRLHSLPLMADSFSADDFRQLRLWLRWKAGAASAG